MEWEGRVVSAHHKLAATERSIRTAGDDPELRKRYDGEFHQALISSCGSRALMQAHAAVFDKYFRYLILALSYRGEIVPRQHQQLLESARKRDAARARIVLTAHINECVDHALASGQLR